MSTECENRNFDRNEKRLRSPAGPRRLGTATRISASLFRRLSAFFGSTHDQAPKAAKFAVLIPGHAGFPNRAKRSEGSNSAPIRNAPCFAVCALVCDPSPKGECVPAFTRKSERGPFVRKVEKWDEKRLGDKIYGGSFAGFFSSAGVEGSQRTGKCMYIKVWRNKRNFTDSTKLRCGRGKAPCFAVCAHVCDPSPKAECVPTFTRESEHGPFVREVEKRLGTAL